MQKQIERRITLQPFRSIPYVHLTNLPLGNLQNPGFGLNVFDFMLPLNGTEKFEVKKEAVPVVGSIEEKEHESKTVTQSGFGNIELQNSNSVDKITKLGEDIYAAMQNADINIAKYNFEPTKMKKKNKIKKLSKQKHNFSLV